MRTTVFIFLILTGCTGYQYVAPLHFVPVNYEKGHGVGNLTYNSCQAGYAFSDHLSAYAMTTFIENDKEKSLFINNKDEKGFYKMDKHNEIELGITRFWNYEDFGSYEILAGVGYGTVKYRNYNEIEDFYDFSFDARKMNFSFQPGISVRYENFIDFSVFSRLNCIRYFNIKSMVDSSPSTQLTDYDRFFNGRNDCNLFFLEPGVQFRAGPEYVKLLIQGSGSIMLGSSDIYYKEYRFTIGISCSLNLITDKSGNQVVFYENRMEKK